MLNDDLDAGEAGGAQSALANLNSRKEIRDRTEPKRTEANCLISQPHQERLDVRWGRVLLTETLLPQIARQGTVCQIEIRGSVREARIEKFEFDEGFQPHHPPFRVMIGQHPCRIFFRSAVIYIYIYIYTYYTCVYVYIVMCVYIYIYT